MAARHFLRRLVSTCALLLAVAFGPLPGWAAPALRQITSVVTIVVPASAFDPASCKAQVTVSRGIVMQVNAAGSWSLRVRATSAAFTYVPQPGTGNAKPVAELQLRPTGGGTTSVITTSYHVIRTGSRTTAWQDCPFDVILQATSADAGGQYTVTLEFNVS